MPPHHYVSTSNMVKHNNLDFIALTAQMVALS
jgi:hypothetical protein